MKLDDYQIKAMETAVYPNVGNNIFYPILGLIGEFGEVLEAKLLGTSRDDLLSELGDVGWYISRVCTELGIKLSDVSTTQDVEDPTLVLCRLAEITKKVMRDNNSEVTSVHVEKYKPLLAIMFMELQRQVAAADSTIEEICELNIQKLFDRKERNKLQGSGDHR